MARFCYCSKILPGKETVVKKHWEKNKEKAGPNSEKYEEEFWEAIGMTGFESWLQETSEGSFYIHCLEGQSLERIFTELPRQIGKKNPCALKLQSFYQEALGKDYRDSQSKPQIEPAFDLSLPQKKETLEKKGFVYPLLLEKESDYRKFCQESMGSKRRRHEAFMEAFDVFRLSTWIQTIEEKRYIVVYSERKEFIGTPEVRLARGEECLEWLEIAQNLREFTGLSYLELSPDVIWLTREEDACRS